MFQIKLQKIAIRILLLEYSDFKNSFDNSRFGQRIISEFLNRIPTITFRSKASHCIFQLLFKHLDNLTDWCRF